MTRPFSPLAAVAAGVVFACIALAAPPAVEHEAPKSAYSPKVAAASEEGQKAIARLKLPAGASAHLWAAEPLLANPVAFAFDSAGKCYVAETFRLGTGVSDNRGHMYWLDDDLASRTVEDRVAMYRKHLGPKFADWEKQHDRVKMVADTKGTGTADSASVFADGFRAAADGLGSGVMAHAGSVYYTCIPNLWKLSDTKGTGTADVKQSLSYGYGVHVAFIGHDSHGLRMGPDGRVYFSIGDRGVNITTKEGRHLFYPDCGAVLRCEPDGSDLEVVHYGLRNPQELAFDKHGNLFTGDNNSDSGDRARWVCIAEGADSGWRIGYQYDTTYGNRGPWNAEKIWHLQTDDQPQNTLPPLEHIGNGPSGLCYNPGVGLPKDWDDHFFLADFRGEAGGSGIWGISVKPKGASFSVNKPKQFVWSTLVTDCDFGPDGFFWSDWVSGWGQTGKGRIYRLDFAAEKDKPQFAETKKLLNDGFEKRPTAELAQLLGHADQRVRMGAQFVLAARGADGLGALAAAAKSAPDLLTRLHGIWGVGQVGRRDPSAFAHVAGLLADADAEVRAQAAKVLGDAKVPAHAAELVRLAADPEARVRFFAAQSLGKLAPLADPATQARAVAALTKLLDPADDRYLRHAAVFALSKLPVAEPAGASANVRLGTLLALRRRQSAEVVKYLDDADPRVVAEAVRAVHDEPIPAGLPKLAAMLARPQLADAVGFRALNANFRIGQPANALAVAQFAGRADQTERLRVEALQMLETWDKPGRRDRVTGLTASLPPRDGESGRGRRPGQFGRHLRRAGQGPLGRGQGRVQVWHQGSRPDALGAARGRGPAGGHPRRSPGGARKPQGRTHRRRRRARPGLRRGRVARRRPQRLGPPDAGQGVGAPPVRTGRRHQPRQTRRAGDFGLDQIRQGQRDFGRVAGPARRRRRPARTDARRVGSGRGRGTPKPALARRAGGVREEALAGRPPGGVARVAGRRRRGERPPAVRQQGRTVVRALPQGR